MAGQRLIPFAIVLLGPIGGARCASQEPAPAAQPPAAAAAATTGTPVQGGTQTAQAGDLVCVTYCSPTEPGTPVAEVRWVVANQPSSAENLRKAAAQQSIEAAVNEDGFERGRFVRLSTVAPQARFAPAGASPAAQLPGLTNLAVSAVAGSQEPASALRLATPAQSGQENVVLLVQGLRPGLNYYWRVRASTPATQVVMCRAPICPSDRRNR